MKAVRQAEGEVSAAMTTASSGCEMLMPLSRAGRCGRALYEGTPFCFWHAPTSEKFSMEALAAEFGPGVTLSQALEREVRKGQPLENAYLSGANIGGSLVSKGPNLSGGTFAFAKFVCASLSYADLTDANVVGADFTKAKLSDCLLVRVNFLNARLFSTKFRNNDLSTALNLRRSSFRGFQNHVWPIEKIDETYPEQAAPMYLELTRYFTSRGMFEDASWSAYRASILRHHLLGKRANWNTIWSEHNAAKIFPMLSEVKAGPLVEYIYALIAWLKSLSFLLLTGYGERPFRVILSALSVIVSFALVYMFPSGPTPLSFTSGLYFSVITFTTLGYGDIVPHGIFRLFAGMEAMSGIVLVGLFLFCIGRRSVSRS
jgi:uncharacterized protein YjbI with pentapeptide repeats